MSVISIMYQMQQGPMIQFLMSSNSAEYLDMFYSYCLFYPHILFGVGCL